MLLLLVCCCEEAGIGGSGGGGGGAGPLEDGPLKNKTRQNYNFVFFYFIVSKLRMEVFLYDLTFLLASLIT
jgi:hypothetical protein